jgi:uncharacterized protein YlxP (DUF503 family)
MLVGVLEIQLRLDGIRSLKDKRHLIRGLIERTRRDFHVSISEVADHDLWGNATIGVAHVSNDRASLEAILGKIVLEFEKQDGVDLQSVCREVERYPSG